MASTTPSDLSYGHFGQALYDIESGSWSFDRCADQQDLRQLATWEPIPPPARQLETAPSEHMHNVHDVKQAPEALGRSHPDMVPSIGLLPGLAMASAAVTRTASAYDPAMGQLLSFGSIALETSHYDYPRRVAALPSGQGLNILKVVMLSKKKHGWVPNRSLWLEEGCIHDGESGYWVADAAPILQVCFAQSESRSTFLAVRLHTKTVLLRPCHYAERKPARPSRFYELPASRVDPSPISSLSLEQTGGSPHADVTFNPDYQRQVGLVDQKGNWSVWDIEGGHKGTSKKYSLTCAVISPMTSSRMGETAGAGVEPDVRGDGWARILWVGDVNTVFVCTRRHMELYDIRGEKPQLLQCSKLIPKSSADWILDVKRHPRYRHQLFVLTSTRLFLMVVTCQAGVLDTGIAAGAAITLSWMHFRGTEDITLQMSVIETSDRELLVFLSSRLNKLITVYRIRQSADESLRPASLLDPTILTLDKELFDSIEGPPNIAQLHVQQLQWAESNLKPDAGPGYASLVRNFQFFGVSLIFSDCSIRRAIIYSQPPNDTVATQSRIPIEPLSWYGVSHTQLPSSKGGLGSSNLDMEKGFIVSDGLDVAHIRQLTHLGSSSSKCSPWNPSRSCDTTWWKDDLVDFRSLCECLIHKENTGVSHDHGPDHVRKLEDVKVLIERVSNMLPFTLNSDAISQGTIFDLVDAKIQVPDVDAASAMLQDLLLNDRLPRSLKLQHIPSHGLALISSSGQHATISSLYDTILHNWIAPLPASIPGRIRQTKERLARDIAAIVMMASIRIRHPITYTDLGSPGQSQTELNPNSNIELPNIPVGRNGKLLDGLDLSFSQPSSPQLLPKSGAAAPSLPSHPNPVARLSQHLQISKPLPIITPNVSRILMHWQPGTDPNSYDWDATTRTVDEELNSGDEEELSHKDKERLKRKAERLLKRQKRERDLERKVANQPLFGREVGGLRSSPTPMVGFRTEPEMSHQAPIQTQSPSESQGFGGKGVVQSQVEPGRHGGRPPKKKRARMRMQGF